MIITVIIHGADENLFERVADTVKQIPGVGDQHLVLQTPEQFAATEQTKAEVERLREEVERLTRQRDQAREGRGHQLNRAEQFKSERDEARAEARRHLEHLRIAHPDHFTPNVLGERLCGCGGQWPCPASATATCTCGSSYATYEGPQADCPVHGAIRAFNETQATIERVRVVWSAWRGRLGGSFPPAMVQEIDTALDTTTEET